MARKSLLIGILRGGGVVGGRGGGSETGGFGGVVPLPGAPDAAPGLRTQRHSRSRRFQVHTHTTRVICAHTHQVIYIQIMSIHIYIFFLNLTYSRWTSSLPSCLWSLRIYPSLPGPRLTNFYRGASSAILQLVNQWLDFYLLTSPRFPLRKKEHKSYFR